MTHLGVQSPAETDGKSGGTPVGIPTATLAALRSVVVANVDKDLDFYDRNVTWPRLASQLVTSLTIVLGAALPFLAAAEYPNKTIVVGGVSVGVAMLTGLAAYWRWTDTWRGYIVAQVMLKNLKARWELELVAASLLPEPQAAEAAVKATRALLADRRPRRPPRDGRALRVAALLARGQGPGPNPSPVAQPPLRRRFTWLRASC
jgi:hypothetical protein